MNLLGVSLTFEPRDVWLGVCWSADWVGLSEFGPIEGRGAVGLRFLQSLAPPVPVYRRLTLYVCLIPCLPIRIRLLVGKATTEGPVR